jgi:hypothetical protein
MAQYHEWLGTLTVGQREDLRKLSDPNMREKRVRELLKEQQEHVESTGPAGGAKAPRGLSSEDLAAVLEVVEQALLSRHLLTEEEKTQLQRKVGLARHMYIVELAYRRPGVPPAQQIGFAPKLGEAMAAGLSNPRQRRFLQSKERPAERSWVLFNLIRAGLMNEYDKKSPDASTLELFFVQLPSDKQDEIMRLPHDRQQQKLTHMYLEKRSEDDPDHYPRPLKPGFWAMQRPPGLRPQGQAGGEPQVRAEGDQPSRENPRKKGNKGSGKKNKAAGGQEDLPDAPEG